MSDKIKAAAKRASSAMTRMLNNEGTFLINANEVCMAMEDLCTAAGADSIHVAKLRRALKKRGLMRAQRLAGKPGEGK